MADDAPNEEESAAERELRAAGAAARPWLEQNRALALGLGSLVLCGVIGIDIYFMLKSDAKRSAQLEAAASSAAVLPRAAEPAAAAAAPSSAPADQPAESAGAGVGVDYESDDGEPAHASKPAPPKHYASVQQAAADSCTIASVDGLSRQIIA